MKKIPLRENIFESFYNIISKPFTRLFLKTKLTPNSITIISGMFGLCACYLVALNTNETRVLAFLFIQLFALLDLVDGDIARSRGLTSNFGHWLDIFFDKLVEALLISAFVYASFQKSENIISLLLGGGIITFHLLIQYLMIINQLHFQKSKKNTSTKILNDSGSNKKIITQIVINLIRFVELHLTLKHSTLLFLLSVFVLLNHHLIGLYVIMFMSLYTLSFMCLYNFFLIKD